MRQLFGKWLGMIGQREEGQGVSEYAIIMALLLLIVVTTVHAIGMNAQQVIDKVNTALHIG
jgi:Flp pilus assembly pilin Flp